MVAAGASSDSDTLERNRRRLEKWRADPVVYGRLLEDVRGFYALPAARQRSIRDLDAKLHSGDLARQSRLWGVLERYGTWLDGLSEEDRRRVLDAPTAEDRLTLIRFLCARDWAERAAPAIKLELGKLPPEQRQKRIAELRAEERKQRRLWDRSLPELAEVSERRS